MTPPEPPPAATGAAADALLVLCRSKAGASDEIRDFHDEILLDLYTLGEELPVGDLARGDFDDAIIHIERQRVAAAGFAEQEVELRLAERHILRNWILSGASCLTFAPSRLSS